MPGVLVQTATRSGPAATGLAPAATYYLSGLTERGPTDEAVALRSMADYERFFGGRVSYGSVYDSLTTFFAEGGALAYVGRAVGAAAGNGFLILQDTAGTPAATLRVEALGAGAWSSGVTVQVSAGTQASTFNLLVAYQGVTETYTNLASPSAAVAALKQSSWVRAIDQGSATAAPANNPAVLAVTALSAGNDDRAAVNAAGYLAALDRLGPGLGAGAVAIPGQAAAAVAAGVAAHAKANHRIGLLATLAAQTPVQAIAEKAAVQAAAADEEYLGLFYPWILVPDGAGGTRTVPPEGYVAGARARAHLRDGAWRAPGGELSSARYVVGVERDLTRAESDNLDDNEVSALRSVAGTVRVYGWRSLSLNEADYALLTGRDVLNYLVTEGEKRLEQYVFRSIDARGHLFSELAAEVTGLVEPIRVAGGLFEAYNLEGDQLDPGYRVDVGPGVNTSASLLASEARVSLLVRIAPTGSLIRLTVTKVGLTAVL